MRGKYTAALLLDVPTAATPLFAVSLVLHDGSTMRNARRCSQYVAALPTTVASSAQPGSRSGLSRSARASAERPLAEVPVVSVLVSAWPSDASVVTPSLVVGLLTSHTSLPRPGSCFDGAEPGSEPLTRTRLDWLA